MIQNEWMTSREVSSNWTDLSTGRYRVGSWLDVRLPSAVLDSP